MERIVTENFFIDVIRKIYGEEIRFFEKDITLKKGEFVINDKGIVYEVLKDIKKSTIINVDEFKEKSLKTSSIDLDLLKKKLVNG